MAKRKVTPLNIDAHIPWGMIESLREIVKNPLNETKDFWQDFFQRLTNACAAHWGLQPFPFRLDTASKEMFARYIDGHIVFGGGMVNKEDVERFMLDLKKGPPYFGGWIYDTVHELLHLQIESLVPREQRDEVEEFVEYFTHKLASGGPVMITIHRDMTKGHKRMEVTPFPGPSFEGYLLQKFPNSSEITFCKARLVDKHESIVAAWQEFLAISGQKGIPPSSPTNPDRDLAEEHCNFSKERITTNRQHPL